MPRFRLLPFCAALLFSLVMAAPAAGQYFGRNKVQYDDFEFNIIETEHFKYYYYPEERQAVTDATRMAERWYHRHSQTFLRQFTEKKPLIFYANSADFQQTNVVSGLIGQGTGGVTESLKERVTLPLTGSYAATNHVLGHELVHSFQYDIGLRERERGFQLGRLPLWLVEGMAEYLSIGRQDPHTTMWLRDYLLRDDLPTIEDLTRKPQVYFPYRFGQAYLAYVGGKYGDPAVTNLFKLAGRVGPDSAFVYALGIRADSLSNEWKQAVRNTYLPLMQDRSRVTEAAHLVLGQPSEDNQLYVGPAVSPDGRYIAYYSRENIFTLNLFVADARTGEVIQKLEGVAADPHFDALSFIESAGSWSPNGERLIFVTFDEGDNQLEIFNVETGEIERVINVQGVGAMSNPAWSPDGNRIVFTGLDGGISDLYLLDLRTSEVRQLTNDRYADLLPTWSPNGETIAFATDRGPGDLGTNFRTMNFAPLGLGLINVETTEIRTLHPFGHAEHYNPQFSPDGRSLYFISTQDGFKDVYRYALDAGRTYRVTHIKTGVSGITAHSPALSVAKQNGRMVFSAFVNGGYSIFTLSPDETFGEPVDPVEGVPVASLMPPFRSAGEGLVWNYLHSPVEGLPPVNLAFTPEDYDATLHLDYIAPPSVGVGVSTGGAFGTRAGVVGGVGFFFSDMLGNQILSLAVQANGTFKDIGGQVFYLNREGRFNYGATAAHIPLLYGGYGLGVVDVNGDGQADYRAINRIQRRIFIDQVALLTTYPLSTTRRFELTGGLLSFGFDTQVDQFIINQFGQIIGRRELNDIPEPDRLYFFESELAYVVDYSYFGFTAPIQGGRYRIAVSPRVGTFSYVQGLIDLRRYFFFEPLTLAIRGLHIGNYGAGDFDASDDSGINFSERDFTLEYLGYPYQRGFVRGYSFSSFSNEECPPMQLQNGGGGISSCSALFGRLYGTRMALVSAELRLPFLGVEQFGLIPFPYLPTQLFLFADGGVTWTGNQAPTFAFETDPAALREVEVIATDPQGNVTEIRFERYPVFSVGVGARVNVLGAIILEFYYAHPFQRPDAGWDFGIRLVPGW